MPLQLWCSSNASSKGSSKAKTLAREGGRMPLQQVLRSHLSVLRADLRTSARRALKAGFGERMLTYADVC